MKKVIVSRIDEYEDSIYENVVRCDRYDGCLKLYQEDVDAEGFVEETVIYIPFTKYIEDVKVLNV